MSKILAISLNNDTSNIGDRWTPSLSSSWVCFPSDLSFTQKHDCKHKELGMEL